MMRPAIFVDRDGVLNDVVLREELVSSPRRIDEYQPIESAIEAVARFKEAGFVVVVITNQPDIERGLIDLHTLDHITAHLHDVVRVDAVMMCPHTAAARCQCRKPQPRLLFDAATMHGIDLSRSWMVGDRWVDIAAGNSAGAKTVLIERFYSWRDASADTPDPDYRAASLAAAADFILAAGRDRAG